MTDNADATATSAARADSQETRNVTDWSVSKVAHGCLVGNSGNYYAVLEGRTFTGEQLVYFLQEPTTGAVKIGVAARVRERLETFQCAHSQRIFVLGICPGGLSLERKLHARFAREHIRGEWFRVSPRVRRWISSLCDHEAPAPAGRAWLDHYCNACGERACLPCDNPGQHACGGHYQRCAPHYMIEVYE